MAEVSVRDVRGRLRQQWLLRRFVGGRLSTRFTTEGRVGRVLSALCHHREVVNDSWVSCVGRRNVYTCRYVEDSKSLLGRRQRIAVESKGRCFVGKLVLQNSVRDITVGFSGQFTENFQSH